MKNKIIYGGISVLLLVVAVMVSGKLISAKAQPKKDNKAHNVMYVKADKVSFENIDADLEYRGRVAAFDAISLAAEVQGKILQGDVRFKTGEKFKEGEVLLKVYREDVDAAIKSAKSSFLQAISRILPDLKVDYPNEFEKWNEFFNQLDVEKPLPQLPEINSNQEKVFLASNNILTNYYSLEQQELNRLKYTVKAPFDGSFKSVNKEIGAIASPGAELASIVRSNIYEIIVPVFPSDLKWINKGDWVMVYTHSNKELKAKVSRISEFVDESSQLVNIYLICESNAYDLLQGEYVDVTIKGQTINGYEIPREAMIDGSNVYELNEGKLKKTKVEVVRNLDDAMVISGIEEGKTIVVESLSNINSSTEYLAR